MRDYARTAVTARLAAAGPQWITVADRLPDSPYQKVIVYCHMFYAPHYLHVGVYKDGKWHFDDSRLGMVTHWMPLPAVPAIAQEQKASKP